MPTATDEYPTGLQQRPTLDSDISCSDQPATWGKVITLDHVYHGRVSIFSYWNRHSGYRVAFLAWDASAKTTVCGLVIKEPISQQMTYISGLMLMKFTVPTMNQPS